MLEALRFSHMLTLFEIWSGIKEFGLQGLISVPISVGVAVLLPNLRSSVIGVSSARVRELLKLCFVIWLVVGAIYSLTLLADALSDF
jgi:hypothetical protein